MPKAKPPLKTPASTAKPLQIFKAGRHTATGGQTIAFSESDLAATCAAYDPALHEAPLVIGHPKHDLPAYGWVRSLAYSEGGIDATPAQVNTDFADMVAAGAFNKISAAFYAPDAANNPVPGTYYLRHVGFLGAQPPAIKGLRTPTFSEDEPGVVTFSEWDDVTNASLWRSLRDWIIGKFGLDEADKVIPSYSVGDLEQSAQQELADSRSCDSCDQPTDSTPPTPAFTEHQPSKAHTMPLTAAQVAAMQAENAALRSQLAAKKSADIHAANVAFCESIPANKLLPAWRGMAVATLDHFAAQPGTLEFGEGEEKAPLATKFKEFLKGLPEVVEFSEIATNGSAKTAEVNPLLTDADARTKAGK